MDEFLPPTLPDIQRLKNKPVTSEGETVPSPPTEGEETPNPSTDTITKEVDSNVVTDPADDETQKAPPSPKTPPSVNREEEFKTPNTDSPNDKAPKDKVEEGNEERKKVNSPGNVEDDQCPIKIRSQISNTFSSN